MNHHKKNTRTVALVGMIALVAILGAVRVGYLLGNQGKGPTSASANEAPGLPAAPDTTPPPAAPQSKGLSPSELATAKNVPAQLQDPAGNYQLVAVIEGEEPNRALTSSLQVVGAQRQRLLGLSAQYDRLPASSLQQRELIAGEILKARQTLASNLQYMAANYGYSLQYNYRLVPHSASLLLLSTGADGTPATQLVHEFDDAASYERFQKMRDDYLLLSVNRTTQDKATSPDGAPPAQPGKEPTPPDTDAAPPGPSAESSDAEAVHPELKAMQEILIREFQYDPKKNHQIKLRKTALYGRAGNR
ncbi:MAG: hypothetical protein CMP28_03830 [Roseibacillus sp.]|nr:hypothetical protein [Roseibacillus sp.]